ncbi:MAG TPA: DJ-1/PfpI family protein, partial [Mycobacterium sp.]|nr:DJ-1/PfpI family protein [Mycobacterium sp.]
MADPAPPPPCFNPDGTPCMPYGVAGPGGAAGAIPGGPAGEAGPGGASGVIPGGPGEVDVRRDPRVLDWVRAAHETSTWTTSVCTGSLLLGAAGLLDGYKATSHWVTRSLLPIFGAIPTEGRVVRDRNRITGGGVTAGIDFGLSLVGSLRDRPYAEAVQLLAEYAPEPPYSSGTPSTAPPEARAT